MENGYLQSFEILKQALANTCRATFPYLPEDLQLWKGADIACFQEVLEEKTKGRISEKSFYNYFKTGKMPREDVLDLFSQMVGAANWKDFMLKNYNPVLPLVVELPVKEEEVLQKQVSKPFQWKIFAALFVGFVLIVGIFFAAQHTTSVSTKSELTICFQDIYTRRPIADKVEVYFLTQKESLLTDSLGCLVWKNDKSNTSFWVKSPYYKADTFFLKQSDNQVFMLKPDDYAMMIRLYASGKIEDWEAHLKKLDAMFAPEAEIIQIEPETGYMMEIWNKEEFIEKLTTPIPSLQRLEILETQYNEKQQISLLRFWQE